MRLSEFIETVPPNETREIEGLFAKGQDQFASYEVKDDKANLYCENDLCKGSRIFQAFHYPSLHGVILEYFVMYKCQNCSINYYTFAIRFYVPGWSQVQEHTGRHVLNGTAFKYGQLPEFNIPNVPPKLLTLIGPDQELYKKARKSEQQGLGVGAFAYYRQIVENLKDRLLSEAIKVANRTGAEANVIESLERAKREYQFTKGIGNVEVVFPPALLIEGENPLTLLHAALSGGLHSGTDEDCLERAHHIRLILVEFSKRVVEVLKDHSELTASVNKLRSYIPKKSLPPPANPNPT
jgi:hypothetical protein